MVTLEGRVSIGGKVTGRQVVLRAPFLEWREVDLGGMLSVPKFSATTLNNFEKLFAAVNTTLA
jgi:hypothetical protein